MKRIIIITTSMFNLYIYIGRKVYEGLEMYGGRHFSLHALEIGCIYYYFWNKPSFGAFSWSHLSVSRPYINSYKAIPEESTKPTTV